MRQRTGHASCSPQPRPISSAAAPCRGEVPEPGAFTRIDRDLELPALRAPRGLQIRENHSSGGSDSFEAAAALDTSLSADSVLTHYIGELRRGGWKTISTPLSNAMTGVVSLSVQDSKGMEWRGALDVMTEFNRRWVTIRMHSRRSY
jgi:hypothetical protein